MGPKATSRKISLKSKSYNENITKRGHVAKKVAEVIALNRAFELTSYAHFPRTQNDGPTINPYILAFFFFLVVGR